METKAIDLTSLQSKNHQLSNTSTPISLGEVFGDITRSYLNELQLFTAHFNTIPNLISEVKINCTKAIEWFTENYKHEIKDVHFIKMYFKKRKEATLDDVFYFVYDDLLVNFDTQGSIVRFLFRQTAIDKVEKIIGQIKKFRKRKERSKPEINLLVNTRAGFGRQTLQITKPKLNIEDNYNDDFKVVHQTIFQRLSKNNNKGLVLLHGKPGTGKTSYIRYLIASLKKEIFFLPPNMAEGITDPSLISILIDNPNSIFVIEDAENIITDRESKASSAVSALLNISDGLLSDCLNIQIICSFNTDISKVDNALMRKGRLIAKYEFKELETEKAQQLSNKLNFDTKIYKPMTLTEIYNQTDIDFHEQKQRQAIGFLTNTN
jgi:hypothetical protein